MLGQPRFLLEVLTSFADEGGILSEMIRNEFLGAPCQIMTQVEM